VNFYRKNNLNSNVVLVNGTARCGKSLVSPIIASFENVEIERMEWAFEHIAVAHHFGEITTTCAINMLRTAADEYLYDSYLSRNINFRWSDHSSVFQNPNKYKYLRRLFRREGTDTVNQILTENPIYQNQSHDQMRYVRLHLQAWPNTFKMIEILRNPIELVDAWQRRGWGSRFGNDPLSFTPCLNFKGEAIPIHAYGWEEEYIEMTPIDRVIKMLYNLQVNNKKSYADLLREDKERIAVIRFEDFVSNTHKVVNSLASFLDTKTSKLTEKSIKKQGCPRIQNADKVLQIHKNIKKQSSRASSQLLEEMIEDYKEEWV